MRGFKFFAKSKKILASVLAVVILFGAMPLSVAADFTATASAAVENTIYVNPGAYAPLVKSSEDSTYSRINGKADAKGYYEAKSMSSGSVAVDLLSNPIYYKEGCKTVFFDNNQGWDKVYISLWGEAGENVNDPVSGNEMIKIENTNIYYYTFKDNDYVGARFKNGDDKWTAKLVLNDKSLFRTSTEYKTDGYCFITTTKNDGQNYLTCTKKNEYKEYVNCTVNDKNVFTFYNNIWTAEKIEKPNATLKIDGKDYNKDMKFYNGEVHTFGAEAKDFSVDIKVTNNSNGADYTNKALDAGNYTVTVTATSNKVSSLKFTDTYNITVKNSLSITGNWNITANNNAVDDNIIVANAGEESVKVEAKFDINSASYRGTDVKDSVKTSIKVNSQDYTNPIEIRNDSNKKELKFSGSISYDTGNETITVDLAEKTVNVYFPAVSVKIPEYQNNKAVIESSDIYTSLDTLVLNVEKNDDVDGELTYKFNNGDEKKIENGLIQLDNLSTLTSDAVLIINTKSHGRDIRLEYNVKFRNTVSIDEESIKYSNTYDDGKRYYTNDKVTVSFKLKDDAIVNDVSLDNKKIKKIDGTYSFEASECRDYIVSIKDKIGNSEECTFKASDIYYDVTSPKIISFDFIPSEQKGNNKIFNFLTFGFFTKDNFEVKVTARDTQSGVKEKEIVLKNSNGNNLVPVANSFKDNGDKTFSMTFECPINDNNPYDLIAYATDNCGNATKENKGYSIKNGNVSVFLNGTEKAETDINRKFFEAVASTAGPKLVNDDITVVFGKQAINNDNMPVYSGNGKFSATITDDLSGLRSINVFFSKINEDGTVDKSSLKNVTKECIIKYSPMNEPKKTEAVITFDTTKYSKSLESGKYRFEIEAINNSLNKSIITKDILVDNTAPEIDKVVFNKVKTNASFGLYSNEKMTVEVYVSDDGGSDKLKSIDVEPDLVLSNGEINQINGKYCKEFTISPCDSNIDMEFTVEDMCGNITTKKLSELNGKLYVGENKKTEFSNLEVVSTTKKASVSDITSSVINDSVLEQNQNLYSGDIKFDFSVTDTLSGIKNIKVELNGNDITDQCKGLPASYKDSKVKNAVVSYTTSGNFVEGENVLTVTVTNNSDNVSTASKKVYIDKTVPIITGFSFNGNAVDKFTEVSDVEKKNYGYFFKEDTTVTVTAADISNDTPTSGVKSICFRTVDVNNGGTAYPPVKVNDKNQAEFKVPANFKGQIYAYAVDKFNNEGNEYKPDDIIIENEEQHKNPSNSNISVKPSTAADKKTDTDNPVDLYNENVTLEAEYSDTYSGIASFGITIVADGVTTINNYTVKNGEVYNSQNVKVTSSDGFEITTSDNLVTGIKYQTAELEQNELVNVSVYFTDNSGNSSDDSYSFSIDKTAPEIKTFKFEKAEDAINNIWTFLSFGIYHNEAMNVTVTASDNFGISGKNNSDIKLYNNDAEITNIVSNENGSALTVSNDKTTLSKTFRLNLGTESLTNLYKLSAQAIDNSGNISDDTSVSNSGVDVYVDGEMLEIKDEDRDNFEAVSTLQKAVISDITSSIANDSVLEQNQNGTLLYSGDIKFDFSVTDTLSGIKNIKVELNGNDITNDCEGLPASYTDSKVENAVVSYTTSDNFVDGKNILKVTVTNNSGNVTEKEKVVYIDKTEPIITGFAFNGNAVDKFTEVSDVEKKNYGYFFKEDTIVTVTAADISNNTPISEVSSICFRIVDIENGSNIYYPVKVDDKNQAEFTVPANFKGQIYAYAVDKFNNEGNEYKPDDVIIENEEQHKKSSSISVNPSKATDKKTDTDNPVDLYNENVTLEAEYSDTYSGIASFGIKIVADGVTTINNYTVKNGEVYNSQNVKVTSRDDFEIITSDNLVTGIKYQKVASKQSELVNVSVYLTDNSGHSSNDSYSFSIDKTAPEIKTFKFEKAEDAVNNIWTFLSFGIYHNEAMNVTVTASDNFGISGKNNSDIKLYNNDAEITNIVSNENGSALTVSNDKTTLSKTFRLNLGTESLTNLYKLSAKAIDNSGNISDDTSVSNSGVDVYVDGEMLEINDEDRDNFEVVSTTQKAVISEITSSVADDKVKLYDNGSELWYSGNVKFDFNATDEFSGIKNIKVELNGNDITNDCEGLPASYTDSKVKNADVSYTTSDNFVEGKNNLKVTVINNSGNITTNEKVVFVDTTVPVITKYSFKSAATPLDDLCTFLSFGIYHNTAMDVTVTAEDKGESAGITGVNGSDIKLYNNDDNKEIITDKTTVANSDGTLSKTFRLDLGTEDLTNLYKLSAEALDNVQNKSEVTAIAGQNKESVKVVMVGKDGTETELSNTTDSFEVISTTQKPVISEITSYPDNNSNTSEYLNEKGEYWYSGNVEFQFGLSDTFSGIKSVNVKFENSKHSGDNAIDVTRKCSIFNGLSDEEYNNYFINSKIEAERDVTFKTADLGEDIPEGENKFTVTLTSNSGNVSTASKTVYIDKTAPKIKEYKFKSAATPLDDLCTFLSFGIYQNTAMDVTVTAVDYGISSGITGDNTSGIELYNNETEIKSESEYIKGSDRITLSKTFRLDLGTKELTNLYKLSAQAWDNVQNISELTAVAGQKKEDVRVVMVGKDGEETELSNTTDDFEVISTTQKAVISEITSSVADSSIETFENSDHELWYSGNVKFDFNVTDEFSGIKSVKAELNGNDITDKCKGLPASYSESKIKDLDVSYTTSGDFAEGKNILKITVINNSGNQTVEEKVVYVDTKTPEITHFDFSKGINEGNNLPVELTPENQNYSYYFKNDTIVTVTATDVNGDLDVSGVEKIYFRTVDVNNGERVYTPVNVNKDNKASFTVPANFKGEIYAYAVDFVKNGEKGRKQLEVKPDDLIVETQTHHDANSSVSILRNKALYKDNGKSGSKLDLYSSDVRTTVIFEDVYAGIRSANVAVSSAQDQNNNFNVNIKVDNSGNVEFSGNASVSYTKSSNNNLVTKIIVDITVRNNSNNISVTTNLVDRAGNTTTNVKDTFSIDKTVPVIDVKYDNNAHTEFGGNDYYKADRTATITVTERNFNQDAIETVIERVGGPAPVLSGWTENYNPADPDSSTYTATILYNQDGDYTFDISLRDLANNKAADFAQQKFTLDKTIPTIKVTFDNNSAQNTNYYKADRVATITIEEHNFNSGSNYVNINRASTAADNTTSVAGPDVVGWSTTNDTHTATINYNQDGKYSFTVDYTDLAGNKAEQEVVTDFYIDKTAPEVKITNVENSKAYGDVVAPIVNFKDNNYTDNTEVHITRIDAKADQNDVTSEFRYTLGGNGITEAVYSYADFAHTESVDGIYNMNISLTDKAGNSSSDEVTFSVNRFGSTYLYGNEETEKLINKGFLNQERDIVISEINVNPLSDQKVTLSKGSGETKNLTVNKDYTIKKSGSAGKWSESIYTIKDTNFVNEGQYTVTISSTDSVKHSTNNRIPVVETRKLPISFVIDKTVPSVSITGIESIPYEEANRDVKIICEDDYLDKSKLVLKLNDKVLEEGEDKDYVIEDSDEIGTLVAKLTVRANEDNSKQSLSASIKDLAGNDGGQDVKDFILAANIFVRFFANTPLVISTFVGLALVAAIIIFIIVKRRKKNVEE